MVPPPPIAISTVIEADVSDLDLKRPINVIADLKKRQRLDWKATHRRDPSSLLNPADFHDNGRSTLKDDCEVGAVLEVTELLGNPSDRTVTTENGDSVPRNVSNIHNNISSKESFQGSIEESDLIQETFVDIETSRGASPLTDSNVGPQQEEASLTTISSKRRTRRQPQFIPSQRDDGGLKRTPQFISTCDSKSSSQQGSTRFLSAAKRTFSSSKKDTLPFEEDQKSPSLSKISARSKILPCAVSCK